MKGKTHYILTWEIEGKVSGFGWASDHNSLAEARAYRDRQVAFDLDREDEDSKRSRIVRVTVMEENNHEGVK